MRRERHKPSLTLIHIEVNGYRISRTHRGKIVFSLAARAIRDQNQFAQYSKRPRRGSRFPAFYNFETDNCRRCVRSAKLDDLGSDQRGTPHMLKTKTGVSLRGHNSLDSQIGALHSAKFTICDAIL